MKCLPNTPHLDPLPSSDERRGNPTVSVKRTPVCVRERSGRFPLPFRRGEEQGEGLLRKTFPSITRWRCTLTLSPRRGNHELRRWEKSPNRGHSPALKKFLPLPCRGGTAIELRRQKFSRATPHLDPLPFRRGEESARCVRRRSPRALD